MGDDETRVLIVDDEPMILKLIRRVLDAHPSIVIVGEAANGRDALEQWRTLRPDIIILDHLMPALTGVEVAAEVLAEDPDQRIILFTAVSSAATATDIGVSAYVLKNDVSSLPGVIAELTGV